jgi:hypothetical protein
MIQLPPSEDFYKAPSYQHYQQNSEIAGEYRVSVYKRIGIKQNLRECGTCIMDS